MLQITVKSSYPARPDDELGRTMLGHDPADTPEDTYQKSRGSWVIDAERASRAKYATVACGGVVVGVFTIDSIHEVRTGRKAFEGTPQHPGDPLYEEHVGKPAVKSRNPIQYIGVPRR